MKSKSKVDIFWIILLAAVVLFCGYKIILNIKEKNEYKARLAVATENAVRYVREKYGFEPEFIKERENDFDREKYGVMYLDFRYNGKEFMVIADCLKDNAVCVDSYQYKEVEQAVINKVLSEYPDGRILSVSVANKNPLFQNLFYYFYAFQTYYDGSNIDEVLTDGSGKLEMIFTDTDFSDIGVVKWLTEHGIDFEFTSFDTEEHLAEFEALPRAVLNKYSRHARLAPHINDHIASGGIKAGISYETRELENFKYCCFEKDDPDNCLTEMDQSEFINLRDYHRKLKCLEQPLSNAYEIDGFAGTVYIYYPLDKLNGIDTNHIGAVWYSESGTETIKTGQFYEMKKKGIERPNIYGDYAVFILPEGTSAFMLADLMERTE